MDDMRVELFQKSRADLPSRSRRSMFLFFSEYPTTHGRWLLTTGTITVVSYRKPRGAFYFILFHFNNF